MSSTADITDLLKAWYEGDSQALDKLIPLVDFELKKIARKKMRDERRNHILQPTALVNEAWMKLLKEKRVDWQSRTQFYRFVARRMRQVLVDYVDPHTAARADHVRITGAPVPPEKSKEIVMVHQSLKDLAEVNERAASIVELRYFGGCTVEEAADILKVAPTTVERESRFARSWLWREMTRKGSE